MGYPKRQPTSGAVWDPGLGYKRWPQELQYVQQAGVKQIT